MRINVYAEELTVETKLVTKVVEDNELGRRTFYGVRMFLKSPAELHHSDEDDDRSAITFWVKWTKTGGTDFAILGALLRNLQAQLTRAEIKVRQGPGEVRQGPAQPGAGLVTTTCRCLGWNFSHEDGCIVEVLQCPPIVVMTAEELATFREEAGLDRYAYVPGVSVR